MKTFYSLLLLLLSFNVHSQVKLSNKADIRVITVGPYQGELYSAFGHSGIRVYDPVNRIDDFYNYGIFNFDQPNFYLNFARGFLNYRVAVSDYSRVANFYSYENRYIHEQVLNLDSIQQQQLFEYLVWNAKPENMYYYYDYFYDNCATRVRDVLEKALPGSVSFDGSYITTDYSIRDLTDVYLQYQPWGDLGIDICLGLPMDVKATPFMYMFLPDYVESGFDHASIIHNGQSVPLVKEKVMSYTPREVTVSESFFTPMVVFTLILVAGVFITFTGYKKKKAFLGIDAVLFSIIGLIGWLLFLLWIATDHKAAARNMNLLWAFPLHFPMGLLLLSSRWNTFKSIYFKAIVILQAITLIGWFFWPQNMHEALIPIVVLLLIRSWHVHKRLKMSI
ncbi:DUF4105 domain-containing protein [Fulvivirga sp. M361]|uniref:lipoprotein N-acyltransferase Lnb domain-containing protein n=1 Tax=Fulvivirga sp. M361 TaxID=2594266 RepID=UPI00117B8496|nr:DUF4105 domain-containing protein [Fulvivirga sp. M361]TRX61323.1 DUF4105 domain-containing protein [Fulvivirga sp. M361]